MPHVVKVHVYYGTPPQVEKKRGRCTCHAELTVSLFIRCTMSCEIWAQPAEQGSSVVERSVWSVECCGFESHPRQLIFLRKTDCLGCAMLLCLVACCFFLPSRIIPQALPRNYHVSFYYWMTGIPAVCMSLIYYLQISLDDHMHVALPCCFFLPSHLSLENIYWESSVHA